MAAADAILAVLERQASELRTLRKGLDKLRSELKTEASAAAPQHGAVKRSVAAKMMGISPSKLDTLVKLGKVATAEDVKLVPLSEVKRYCAPKPKRGRAGGRRPRLVIDETSADAVAAMKRELRKKRVAGGAA